MSFVEIAKEVGRQWRDLDPVQKTVWEDEAARDLEQYERELEVYKTTEDYHRYKTYVENFRARQKRRKEDQAASSWSSSFNSGSVGSAT